MLAQSLQQVLTQVISDMLAQNRSYFGAGGPGYYGVRAENLSTDGSEFDLNLTFKSGVRYCCIEHGCHIPLYSSNKSYPGWFKQVRDRLESAGIDTLPSMTIRRLRVVVEAGAISDGLRHEPVRHETRLEYALGPLHEIGRTHGEPSQP